MGEAVLTESEPFKREQLRLLPQERPHFCRKLSVDDEICGYCGKTLQTPRGVTMAAYLSVVALTVIGGWYLLNNYVLFLMYASSSARIQLSAEFLVLGGFVLSAGLFFLIVSAVLWIYYRRPVRYMVAFSLVTALVSAGFTLLSWIIFAILLLMGIVVGGALGSSLTGTAILGSLIALL